MKAINSLGGNRWSLMSSTSLCWLLAHESRDVFQAETKITLVSLPNLAILSEKTIIFVVVFPQSHFLCENVPCFKLSTIFTTHLRFVWYSWFMPLHRGAFCQSSFRSIYYYGSNKSTGNGTGKSHLCAVWRPLSFRPFVSIYVFYLLKDQSLKFLRKKYWDLV